MSYNGYARLTDFGLASIVRGANSATQGDKYTVVWTAPEILEGVGTITREVDAFALGIVVTEVRAFCCSSKIMGSKRPAHLQEGQELALMDSVWDMTIRCWH